MIDFDGTLIDSETILFNSWRKVYEIFGFKLNLEYWFTKIRPDKPHAAAYYSLYDLMKDPPTPEIAQSIQNQIEKQMMEKSTLRPGMRELLEYCKGKANIRVALVTSSKSTWIQPHIEREKIQSYFDLIVTTENVNGKKKPDPSCFLYALNKLKSRPEYAIAIEDSPWGLISAKNAGLTVIAFPNQITQHMDLSAADLMISNGLDLLPILWKNKRLNCYENTF